MPTYDFDGYEYVTTTSTNEICETIYDPDGDINQWLDENGVNRVDTTDGICVGVGIATAVFGSSLGPFGSAGSFIIGTGLCESGKAACAVEDFATGLSGCGDLELEVHVAKQIPVDAFGQPVPSQPGIVIGPKCESGLSISDVVSAIEDAGGNVVDQGESLVDQGIDTGSDLVDDGGNLIEDGVDAGSDILDQGADLIGF